MLIHLKLKGFKENTTVFETNTHASSKIKLIFHAFVNVEHYRLQSIINKNHSCKSNLLFTSFSPLLFVALVIFFSVKDEF